MRIAFTGGGTGGHFYPIIAIAEALRDLAREGRLIEPELYFFAPAPFDDRALFENGISYVRIPAGKVRRYFSLSNLTGLLATLAGLVAALTALFRLYPDVLVSKGGYGSVPSVLAARVLGIPLIIHESDAKPGRANLLAGKFASRIAVSFDETAAHFPPEAQARIARTGIPVRKALMRTEREGARQLLALDAALPTILVLGGSLGSVRINDTVLAALPELISFANILHQTGQANFESVSSLARVALEANPHKNRYHPESYFSETTLQRAAGAADLVISRAGASAIAEIGLWQKPAILIPIPESISHDQRTNAHAYAETGAAVVLEEGNLTPHILASEARRILGDPQLAKRMGESGAGFTDPEAARTIAREALQIALSHD